MEEKEGLLGDIAFLQVCINNSFIVTDSEVVFMCFYTNTCEFKFRIIKYMSFFVILSTSIKTSVQETVKKKWEPFVPFL